MIVARLGLALILCVIAFHAVAEDDPHAADRALLKAMLAEIEQALNEGNFQVALKHLHPDVIITYYNAEVTRGHDEAVAYFNRMMEGPDAVVKEYSTQAEVGSPALFLGDTAVAYGTTTESYELAGGLEFMLNGNWSTTVQKLDGVWMVRAIHFSTNLFDNPLLKNAQRMGLSMAGGTPGWLTRSAVCWLGTTAVRWMTTASTSVAGTPPTPVTSMVRVVSAAHLVAKGPIWDCGRESMIRSPGSAT